MSKERLIGIVFLIVIIAAFAGIGYWLWASLVPSKSEVNTKKEALKNEIKVVDTNILDQFDISTVQKYKVFGTFPITIPPELTGRTNPFSS